ncbi:MAG: Npt1/Npt2 family nucleotide transporter [Polyangiaceae bacterium]
MTASETQRQSLLERALGVVTRVQPGEGVTALLLTVDVFLLMTAYSAIKPVREGLILAMKSGAEYKSYMGAAIAVALLFAVPAYSRFADRLPRNRLIIGVTLFFAANLVAFWLASAVPSVRQHLGLVFYLWLGIFNMMVVAQFWAFANDLYREEQGKRLFPLLGVGQTVGAVAGSGLAALLLQVLGVFPMLLASAALLTLTALLTQIVHARESSSARREKPAPPDAQESGSAQRETAPSDPREPGSSQGAAPKREGAFALVAGDPYLRYVALFTVAFTFVNTNGEYMIGKLVTEAARGLVERGELPAAEFERWVSATYSRFYLYVNVATVALQALVVSRLVRVGGMRVAFFVLPSIALLDALGVSALPVLGVLFIGKVAENATDYSLNNTLRNMLWLPTTSEMKYKAKQAIDTFFVRMGDVSSALIVYVGAGILGHGVRTFALVNLVLVLGWLAVARRIVKAYEALSARDPDASSS